MKNLLTLLFSSEPLLVLALAQKSYNASGVVITPNLSSSTTPFSSTFQQPSPPVINAAFRANYIQHKWDFELSHVVSGFFYYSPANQAVRVDAAYDKTLQSGFFNYKNTTSDGLVENIDYSWTPSVTSQPQCATYMVNSDFPLFPPDLLVNSGAVYAGTAMDELNGIVTMWEVLYQSIIPVTLYLNSENSITRYDYFAPDRRTKVITKLFNIILGETDAAVFEFPKCSS
ncbi:MAG: hypothetical protein M1816_003706 [Peltula sp. TS41687]|nr:MAG: hypothetical protein M1816_003706 [Peltula sp. TS41687]